MQGRASQVSASRIAALLAANLLFTESAGILTRSLSLGLGMLGLALFASGVPTGARCRGLAWGGRGLELTAGALLLWSPGPLCPSLVVLFLAGSWLRAGTGGEGGARGVLARLAIGSAAYAVLALLAAVSPAAGQLGQALSHRLTGLAGRPGGDGIALSTSFSGAAVALLFLCTAVSRVGLGAAAGVAVSWAAYALAITRLPAAIQGLAGDAMPADLPARLLFAGPSLLFLFLLPNLRPARRGPTREDGARGAPPVRLVLGAAAAVLVAIAIPIASVPRPGRVAPGGAARPVVVLYERGFVNWLRPTTAMYGRFSAGMFGTLPDYLESIGIAARRTASLGAAELEGAAALVMINIDHPIPEAEREALWRFVAAGGALLVLGDHTFEQNGVSWQNELLAPTHIRFNFDSAGFLVGGWLHSYAYAYHPLVRGLTEAQNEPGIVIGASLAVEAPAAPLIVGRYGWSDRGDRRNARDGSLGNMRLDPGETAGDLVLAAVEPYGRGKVLVFGDTSGFTNLIAATTHPFLGRVFTWLTRPTREGGAPRRELLAAASAAGGLALAFAARLAPPLLALVLAPAAVVWQIGPDGWAGGSRARLDPIPRGRIAYVDMSHLPRVPLDFGRDRGLMGLMLNLYRRGYHGLWLHELDAERLAGADLVVIIAPARRYTARDLAAIRSFVERGGRLVVAVGYEERGPAAELLAMLDFTLDPVPLGHASAAAGDGAAGDGAAGGETATFVEAWPVRDLGAGAIALAETEGYPVVLARRLGRGAAVLIGDSSFFINRNLEHDDHPHLDSIGFLNWLLDRVESMTEETRS